jgi:uncharacterized protein (TIGR02246 family)
MRAFIARGAVALVLGLAVGACSNAQQSAQSNAPDHAAAQAAAQSGIDSLNQAFVAAMAARDTDGVVAFYAEDATILPQGMKRAEGHSGIRTVYADFLKIPGLVFEAHSDKISTSDSGELAVDVGTYTMKWQDPKGKEMSDTGKYVTVLKKEGGAWKIIVDTFNSDTPAPGM